MVDHAFPAKYSAEFNFRRGFYLYLFALAPADVQNLPIASVYC